ELDDVQSAARVVEVIGLPKNRTISQNTDQLIALSRYTGEMAICLNLVSPQVNFLQQGIFNWVGFTMRDTKLDGDAAMEAMMSFASLARRFKVKIYAREIPTENLAMAAIGSGIRYILGNPFETPGISITGSYQIKNLYR
ncbi:MAG: hypothetical protein HQ494_15910, partial [Rhodospirillales bacterium]|nr:hypothetical protein [Rhodospirillales bacterium]